MSRQRREAIDRIARHLASREPGHPLRVGIDGVCGSGKSTLARDLAARLTATGRPVVHLDSDGFHHVAARRRRQDDEARGYYEDAYDFDALVEHVLLPLGPAGSRRYATAVHDLATDAVIDDHWRTAPWDAIVLFDATFLQRGHLRAHWTR